MTRWLLPVLSIAAMLLTGCFASHVASECTDCECTDCVIECSDFELCTVDGELTTASPLWARPTASPLSCSGGARGGEQGFATHLFWNDGPARAFDIALDGNSTDGRLTLGDPYLIVYQGDVIPSDPSACLGGDDDGGPGLSSLATVMVPAGARFTVVATTYGSGDFGSYRIRVVGRP